MPALDLGGTDPCSLLNTQNFPTLWLTESGDIESQYRTIFASPNVLQTYVDAVTQLKSSGKIGKQLLTSLDPRSGFSLIQFLSNGSIARQASKNGNSIDYSTLENVVLSTQAQIYGIVDSYIVGQQGLNKGDAYAKAFSTDKAPLLKDTDLWDPQDSAQDKSISNSPKSVLGCLLRDGFLMTSRELFIPEEFNPSSTYKPKAGEESLVFLYRLGQKGTNTLSPEQQARKAYLEVKNLRFFGAFLVEYCFYRTRYESLLKQYFNIYSKPKSGAGAYSSPASLLKLFKPNTPTPVTQQEYLKQLAEQLAILNTRLTDLRLLLGKISMYYNSVYLDVQNTINSADAMGSNQDLVNRITALNQSAKVAQKYLSDLDFHQGVMQYNAEKNRYGNMLLGFYAFLNIAAVAAILQINQQ